MISISLALGFAGDVADFGNFFATIDLTATAEQIAMAAVSAYAKGARFDVLIATVGSPHLHIVKTGILKMVQSGFIGDGPAYGKYQEAFHAAEIAGLLAPSRASMAILRCPEPRGGSATTAEPPPNSALYTRMFNSLLTVIESRQFPSVGGLVVPLCTDKGEFSYLNYGSFTSDILRPEYFTDEPRPISAGTAEGGGGAFEFSPARGSPCDLGFFFSAASFGAVFLAGPSKLKFAKLVTAKTFAHWAFVTNEIFGAPILCGFMTPDHCGIAGEEFIAAGRFEDAIFCYELGKSAMELDDRTHVRDRFFYGYAFSLANLQRLGPVNTTAIHQRLGRS